VPASWTSSLVDHCRAAGERATEGALGVVTIAWACSAAPLAWGGLSALATGLGQQCQVMGQKSAQHRAADFSYFLFSFIILEIRINF
jgi:hypothetical protein